MKKISFIFPLFSLLLLTGCPDNRAREHVPGGPARNVIPSHFQRVSFNDLPGWREDDVRYALLAFRQSCRGRINTADSLRVIPDARRVEELCRHLPRESASVATVRTWFEANFQPFRVRDPQGNSLGLYTGYYAPVIPGCRVRTAHCNEPLMAVPTDGREFRGVPRERIVREMIGRPLYWANIVDVQNIQIQGSGTIRLECGTHVRLGFAAVNDMPFRSPGQQLIERGIRPAGGMSAGAVSDHLRKYPALAREVITNNQRYVFFQRSPTADVVGAMGVPLTRIRSIAIDNTIYSLGMPVFVDTRLSNGAPFRRLMVAQDTGGAIRGWIRVDLYFGEGPEAFEWASGHHHRGEKFIFMPR